MTTVTHLPNGQYMMTYEYGGGPTVSGTGYSFPVYYRMNENPLYFNSFVGYPVVSNDGIQPVSSPYITWSPVGGVNGTIVVSSGTCSQVFTNQALGDVSAWKTVPTPGCISYTRHLRVLCNPDHLLIMGAGHFASEYKQGDYQCYWLGAELEWGQLISLGLNGLNRQLHSNKIIYFDFKVRLCHLQMGSDQATGWTLIQKSSINSQYAFHLFRDTMGDCYRLICSPCI